MPQANQTEQATPRRRQKAREKGQVARSRDLIGASASVAATLVLFTQMSAFPQLWRRFFRDCVEGAASGSLRMDALTPLLTHASLFAATGAALGLGWVVALSSAVAQGGLVFVPTSLLPTLSRISPAARMRQLFSIAALRSFLKSALPGSAVVCIGLHLSAARLDRAAEFAFAQCPRSRRVRRLPACLRWAGNPRLCFCSGHFSTTSSNAATSKANCA